MRSWSKEVFSLNIGKKISELRNKNGMSQQALADSLFVSRDLVSKWENGTRRPNYRMIEKIAEVSGVDLYDKRNLKLAKDMMDF